LDVGARRVNHKFFFLDNILYKENVMSRIIFLMLMLSLSCGVIYRVVAAEQITSGTVIGAAESTSN
jgi:hypothetical protein